MPTLLRFVLPSLIALLASFPLGADESAKAPDVDPLERGRAETLFAKVRGAEKPREAPCWKEFLASPAALAVAREHLAGQAEPDRGVAAALCAVAALEGAKAADDCALYALQARSERVRQAAREALRDLDVPTPKRVVHALRARRELGLRALDLIKDRPDEAGLFGIVVAADFAGYGGGGPRSYIYNGTQYAYIKDITAVVQVQAVGYDPEIGYIETATILDAKVLKTEELRRVFYEITGVRFDSTRKAQAWWEAHKDEVMKRIEERSAPKAPLP